MTRHDLSGPTMGTRWQALFHARPGVDVVRIEGAMAAAIEQVDQQMSTWKPDSDLNRLSAAAPETWVDLPAHLMAVLARGVQIGAQSGGAFDIGLGDAVAAWGFGPDEANEGAIYAARDRKRAPAHKVLELDVPNFRARKHAPMRFDLSGIAKGYGVDRLAEVALDWGQSDALLTIDGEVRALGHQPDGRAWSVAVAAPLIGEDVVHSVLELSDAAVATSGDYRHWVTVNNRHLGHTMDPARGFPLLQPPSSVTVIAPDCCSADGWATAFMVLGEEAGGALAESLNLSVLFLTRGREKGVGTGVFATPVAA